MKEKTKYYLACFVATIIVICLLIGFVVGKRSVKIKETVRYEKGETITKIVDVPVPYEVIKWGDPIFIYKTDTINNIITQKVDTAKIIEDWILNRKYNVTLFDNDNGKLNIDASVQYNQLKDLQYTFTPIQKVITKQKVKLLEPFVSSSCSTFKYIGLGGGVFYHNLGLEYQYQIGLDDLGKGHSFGLKYKF